MDHIVYYPKQDIFRVEIVTPRKAREALGSKQTKTLKALSLEDARIEAQPIIEQFQRNIERALGEQTYRFTIELTTEALSENVEALRAHLQKAAQEFDPEAFCVVAPVRGPNKNPTRKRSSQVT